MALASSTINYRRMSNLELAPANVQAISRPHQAKDRALDGTDPWLSVRGILLPTPYADPPADGQTKQHTETQAEGKPSRRKWIGHRIESPWSMAALEQGQVTARQSASSSGLRPPTPLPEVGKVVQSLL